MTVEYLVETVFLLVVDRIDSLDPPYLLPRLPCILSYFESVNSVLLLDGTIFLYSPLYVFYNLIFRPERLKLPHHKDFQRGKCAKLWPRKWWMK